MGGLHDCNETHSKSIVTPPFNQVTVGFLLLSIPFAAQNNMAVPPTTAFVSRGVMTKLGGIPWCTRSEVSRNTKLEHHIHWNLLGVQRKNSVVKKEKKDILIHNYSELFPASILHRE